MIEHQFTSLEAWRQARPKDQSVVYVATDKDAKALISALCGDCDGGPLSHTDYQDPTRTLAGIWEGVPIYRGAQTSHFVVVE
ncbi:hypothetical protein [Nannocystis sp. SCPEA4]|uniref:hypothetical protein n=1 Tax=Nannocystis sp. SCPEA4 TaxID=2996787 RepID=UPI002271D9C2|nr:hypothetical protein [Nannocystis sp. SCPEA4]MCY1055422.1 hypothetical protein [Nannocystis sp. SCPEA4]